MNTPEPSAGLEESVRPLVAKTASNRSLWLFAFVLVGGGFFLFRGLETRREALTAPSISVPADSSANVISAPPVLDIPASSYELGYPPQMAPDPAQFTSPRPPSILAPERPSQPIQRSAARQSYPAALPAPAPPAQDIIADQAPYRRVLTPPDTPEPPSPDGNSSTAGGKERVEAARFANPATTVPKGTVIQAVLETALDSNRAGFARAVVSRDVMGFDGSKVLIPRGSRIIGEYKSDVSLGQNRVLIQWQRLMRPDGIVINIDSPSADPLGRAGVRGKVDTHFFQRFSGAILQSALDIGTQLATREVSRDAIYIGLPGLGQSLAPTPEKIAPTIRVRQGKSVSVFVARDLDFTKAGQ